MAENTKNLNLKKPAPNDFYNVNDFNENFQKLDDFAGRKDNPHGVTAGQVGALPTSGGVMTGKIEWHDGQTQIDAQGDGNFVIRNLKLTEEANDDAIVFHNTLDLQHVLQIYRNGTPYLVYGEHNKPTASDVGALSRKMANSNSTLEVGIGNHVYIHNLFADNDVPTMPVESNFTHYTTLDENRKVLSVLSIPIDYSNKAYYYTDADKLWHEIADEAKCAKIQTGYYVGTGSVNGAIPQMRLSFDFTPRIVMVSALGEGNSAYYTGIFIYGTPLGMVYQLNNDRAGSIDYPVPLGWNENVILWNSTRSNFHNLSVSGITYYWVAIG